MLRSSGGELGEYYGNELYPFNLIYRMMTCNNKATSSAESRIIGVQFQADSNVYVMHDYKRDTCQALKHKMLLNASRMPESLHMAHIKEGKKLVRPQKELVFDMDITDFTRFCGCRELKRLCPACWVQMQGASLILDYLLEEQLGYAEKHRLWVFSGGKGLHCFVNDCKAMKMGDKERMQLHKRLSITAGDDTRLATFIRSLMQNDPAFIARMEDFFMTRVMGEQDFFRLPPFIIKPGGEEALAMEESFETFCLRHLRVRHPTLYHHVQSAWHKLDTQEMGERATKKARHQNQQEVTSSSSSSYSMKKWRLLRDIEGLQKGQGTYKPSVFLMFRLLYPVIDPGPFKLSHQIKLPFSVHSRTRNVALPLTQEAILAMDISKDTLSIDQLCFYYRKNNKAVPTVFKEALRLMEDWINVY